MHLMARLVDRADEIIIPALRRWAIPALRIGLAVVFVWFGALKIFGVSPVSDLVASTVYWFDPGWFVPVLGVVEVAVGLGLAFRFGLRSVLAVLLAQLAGTLLVFVFQPEVAYQEGNPLLLTTEGEFVVKNAVLLGAAMVVGTQVRERSEEILSKEGSH